MSIKSFKDYLAWALRSLDFLARRLSFSPLFLFLDAFLAGRDFFNFFMKSP